MKIDFHVHTVDSPCSDMSLKAAVKAALDAGLSGIAICNHDKPFLKSDIPSDLEKEFNIKINPETPCENAFYIIPGIEITYMSNHLLGLFVEHDCHSPVDIRACGGLVVHAHPFEKLTDYNSVAYAMRDHESHGDLIETHSGRAAYKNKAAISQAIKLSKEFSISECAGSDAHFVSEIGNAWMEFDDAVFGLEAIKRALLSNAGKGVSRRTKRVNIAKSQIVKHGYTLKTIAFYLYCYIRDIGDKLCQK